MYFIGAEGLPQICEPGESLTFNGDKVRCYRIKGDREGTGSFKVDGNGAISDLQGGESYFINVTDGSFDENPY